MNRKNVPSGSPFEKTIGFSRAVRIGNQIAISGTAAIDEEGKNLYPDDPARQAKRCLEIIEKAVIDAGGTRDSIIRTRIYMKDINQWGEVAKVHGEYFSDIRPACTFIEVSRFINSEWLVEIEADAVVV